MFIYYSMFEKNKFYVFVIKVKILIDIVLQEQRRHEEFADPAVSALGGDFGS
jgi:hypothetical protein